MRKSAAATLAGILLLVAGCTGDGGPSVSGGGDGAILASAASLERFEACPELLDYLRDEGTKRVGPYGLQGTLAAGMTMEDGAVAAESGGATGRSTAAAPADASSGAGAGSFSSTNVQERDVDEPDTVKTDGRTIFTTRMRPNDGRTELVSIGIDDGRPRAGGRLELPEGAGTDLLIDGGRALVLGGFSYAIPFRGGPAIADMAIYPAGDEEAKITIVDISNPAEMRILNTLKFEGTYSSARMVDGVVRIVLNTTTQERLDLEQPADPTAASAREALQHNRRATRTAAIEDWLPRFEIEDDKGATTSSGQLASCDTTYRPQTFSGFQTTTVVTVDPDDPKPAKSAAVLGGAGITYASTGNLYVATQRWPEPIPVDLDEPTVSSEAFTPDPASTQIHRFDIRSPERANYAGSGDVRGTVLNQWSLSEHDGHLRVATTEDAFKPDGATASSSFVTVLQAAEGELKQVGQVGNIGPGERIYGVRFIGDLGYVVTFKQIDPLHVVDLAEPSAPKVVGELKIPGYSAYLHPVGDGRLLGVGQDVDPETTAPLGTQLSLFDVTDPKAPKRIDDVRIDQSNSPVENDHHAFTWWEPSKLAVVPVSRYGGVIAESPPSDVIVEEPSGDASGGGAAGSEPGVSEPDPGAPDSSPPDSSPPDRAIAPEQIEQLHVAIGYRIDGDEIREVGRANHASHVSQDPSLGMIQRSLVIGEQLFTLSTAGVMSSELGSFAERGWYAF